MRKEKMDVTVNFKGGGSFINLKPILSSDGESVFVAWKNYVLEYNTKTGKLLYEYRGLVDRVVGFSHHILNSYHCITACSETGKIIIWKTNTHYVVSEKQLPFQRVKTFHFIPSGNEELVAIISYVHEDRISFAMVDLKTKISQKYELNIKLDERGYFVGNCSDKYFSVVHSNSICFVKLKKPKNISRAFINDSRIFTCIACHPSEDVVLTGDSSGRVLVWQNIFSSIKTPSVFHWHTLPVRTVSFSYSGSYFYSGGDECVLVKWQFENVNDRQFVPRIAAEINHVTVADNNLYIAVATCDNAIRILDSTLNQITVIQQLVFGKHYSSGILYDPRTKALIMNGNQGQIQFYSPDDMSLLYNVDIVGQNKVTNERGCEMVNTEISKVAISKSGLWLSTVEERKDKTFHAELRLKFWKFNEEKQMFELNTSIEYPHDSSINSILFQPVQRDDSLICVTVGDDKKFKVWQLAEAVTIYKKGVVWKCFSIGYYRDLSCSSLSFSVDGSLMATGFGSILTAWVPDSCELKCSLVHPIYKETIKFVQFGYSNQCHLLVSASENQLNVWNILTLSMVWTVPVAVSLLIADPLSTIMAVITKDKKAFVFTPASPLPVYSSGRLLKKHDIVASTFIPSKYCNDARMKWFERSQIYFITSSNELYCLCGSEDNMFGLKEDAEAVNKSVFSMMMANSKSGSVQSVVPQKHIFEKDTGHKTLKKYLAGPIHTMPPIRFSCYSLLKSLINQKVSSDLS